MGVALIESPEIGTLDHYAMAVRDADRVASFYTDFLGFRIISRQDCVDEAGDHRGDARLITLALPGDSKQLVIGMPLHENSALHETIREMGEGVHHVAYIVDNLVLTMEKLRARGISFTTEGAVTDPVTGLQQVFIRRDQAGGVFVELIERGTARGDEYLPTNASALVRSEARRSAQ